MAGVTRVLYRLPEVLAAVAAGAPIYIVEGEKDADQLTLYGLTATTNVGGAGKWKRVYSAALAGAHVVILPDNDAPGATHGDTVAASLHGVAASLKVVTLPGLLPKGDVSDWLAAGHTIDELHALVAATAAYTPPEARRSAPWPHRTAGPSPDCSGLPLRLEHRNRRNRDQRRIDERHHPCAVALGRARPRVRGHRHP